MMVRLYDTLSDTSIAPLTQSKVETSNSMLEEQFVFKGSKDKDYYMFIYYKGERQFDSATNEEICEYYNVFVAVETLQKVKQELRCLDEDAKKNLDNPVIDFVTAIPNYITDKDFKNGVFEFKSFTEIKFPQAYNGQSYLMKLIEIET